MFRGMAALRSSALQKIKTKQNPSQREIILKFRILSFFFFAVQQTDQRLPVHSMQSLTEKSARPSHRGKIHVWSFLRLRSVSGVSLLPSASLCVLLHNDGESRAAGERGPGVSPVVSDPGPEWTAAVRHSARCLPRPPPDERRRRPVALIRTAGLRCVSAHEKKFYVPRDSGHISEKLSKKI